MPNFNSADVRDDILLPVVLTVMDRDSVNPSGMKLEGWRTPHRDPCVWACLTRLPTSRSSSEITVLVVVPGHGAVDFPFRSEGS